MYDNDTVHVVVGSLMVIALGMILFALLAPAAGQGAARLDLTAWAFSRGLQVHNMTVADDEFNRDDVSGCLVQHGCGGFPDGEGGRGNLLYDRGTQKGEDQEREEMAAGLAELEGAFPGRARIVRTGGLTKSGGSPEPLYEPCMQRPAGVLLPRRAPGAVLQGHGGGRRVQEGNPTVMM